MPTFDKRSLKEFTALILQQSGAPEDSADCVVDMLIEGDCSGHPSHGLIRLPQYVDEIRSTRLDPRARPEVSRQTPLTALVDGNRGFGQVTASLAVDIALEIVRKHGLAAVGATRTFHIGRLGDYPERAAREGFIGLAWANGLRSPASVAPFGGRTAAHGTNPVAVAVPRPDGAEPIVVDFATSVLAEGKLRVARNRGSLIPPGVILDANGNESTDPNHFYEGGCLLPIGGHKGYGLSVVCDLLAGLLTGSKSPCMPDYEGSNSVMLILLDPECFRPNAEFLHDVGQFCDIVTSTPTAAGTDQVLMPGDPEIRERAKHAETVDVDEPTWQQLVDVARKFSLDVLVPESP